MPMGVSVVRLILATIRKYRIVDGEQNGGMNMIRYDDLIRDELKGATPKERYDFLIAMKNVLMQIAYPRRGTVEETWTLEEFSVRIQETIGREKLEEA